MTAVDAQKVIQKLQMRLSDEITHRAICDAVIDTLNERIEQGVAIATRVLEHDATKYGDEHDALTELLAWTKG